LEKGSYEIVRTLVEKIKHSGGDFVFNRSAERIVTNQSLSKKIVISDGEIACNTVISNIDIFRTIHKLIGAEKFLAKSIAKINSIQPSISAFEIFLGIDADLKSIYPEDYEIFVNSNYDLDKQYRDCIDNNAETAPFVITINSNVNKFSAPARKSVVTIIMLAGYDYWKADSRQEYEEKKNKITDILIARTAKIIPEVKTCLKDKVVSTPMTFESYTDNTRGAIYGYTKTFGQRREFRPNEMTTMLGLYFASAWTRQGSGVAKVLYSAEDVFKKIAKQAGALI